jgi:putative DNA primase/helicase
MSTAAIRTGLVAHGYVPVAVIGKVPVMAEWQKLAPTAEEIAEWPRQYPRATNTGMTTKANPAVDIDIEDPKAAELIEALVRARFEGRILVRTGRAPRRAIPMRTDAPFSKLILLLAGPDGAEHKIEILADGQQVVVHGKHPDTSADYTWDDSGSPWTVDADELPPIGEAEARAFLAEAEKMLAALGYKVKSEPRPKGNGAEAPEHIRAAHGAGRGLSGDPHDNPEPASREKIERAMAAIPNLDLSWDDWVRIGLALFAATDGDGFAVFDAWSKKCKGKYNKKLDTAQTWQGFRNSPPDRIGAGTIFFLADEADPSWRDEPEPKAIARTSRSLGP